MYGRRARQPIRRCSPRRVLIALMSVSALAVAPSAAATPSAGPVAHAVSTRAYGAIFSIPHPAYQSPDSLLAAQVKFIGCLGRQGRPDTRHCPHLTWGFHLPPAAQRAIPVPVTEEGSLYADGRRLGYSDDHVEPATYSFHSSYGPVHDLHNYQLAINFSANWTSANGKTHYRHRADVRFNFFLEV